MEPPSLLKEVKRGSICSRIARHDNSVIDRDKHIRPENNFQPHIQSRNDLILVSKRKCPFRHLTNSLPGSGGRGRRGSVGTVNTGGLTCSFGAGRFGLSKNRSRQLLSQALGNRRFSKAPKLETCGAKSENRRSPLGCISRRAWGFRTHGQSKT